MSQIAFPLSHSALVEIPLCYTVESTFGTKKTSSPVYTAVKVVSQVTPRIDNQEIDVRQLGSHLKYGHQSSGHRYGATLNLHPFDLPFLQYGSQPPNYTTPSGTSAESLQFLVKHKQAQGTAGMNSYFVFYLGCKINTLQISVSSGGLVEVTAEIIAREITVPSTSSGLTTPTLPAFSDYSDPVLSNVDAGNKPLTINGTAYAIDDFNITWNNNLIQDSFIGSGLIDALTVGAIEISGSFMTPAGQDLLLETATHDFPQNGVTAVLTVKTGTMIITMTGFKLMSDDDPWSEGPTQTKKHNYSFVCTGASITAS